jgi:hypothetical protein
MLGKLSKAHTKLSCLEGLGLRSAHKVEETSREEYIRSMIPLDADDLEVEVIELSSTNELPCKA